MAYMLERMELDNREDRILGYAFCMKITSDVHVGWTSYTRRTLRPGITDYKREVTPET
jgi:hypothetical protein